MYIVIEEILRLLKGLFKRKEYRNTTDPKEKEYMKQVEIQRQRTNLLRSMIAAIFFVIVLFVASIWFVMQGTIELSTIAFMLWVAIVMTGYVLLAERYYCAPEDLEDVSQRRKVSVFYISFWCFYCILISTSPKSYVSDTQGVILWMVMIFIIMCTPVFSSQELRLALPVALLTSIVHLKMLGLPWMGVGICGAVIVFLMLFAQINQGDHLESYYQIARNRVEFYETKRRLGKVFEEVFDMAFEFDLSENTCDVLRSNGNYDMYEGDEVAIDKFLKKISAIVHPDDATVCEKNLNMANLNEAFLLGNTQVYFEMRLKNKEENYNWVSVFITKENEYEAEDYFLCLVQDIEDRKRNENKLRLEAEKDPLTQLYNKVTTRSLIEECLENNSSSQHALMIIDIDNFKTINDTKGHAVGDQILLAFTEELNKNFRETDILGRVGGDEFIILIKNVQSVAMICDKLQRLTASFKKYGIDHGFPGRLSTSIGVSIFNKDGKTYEELFRKADAALYEAKRNGKDQYKFSISRTQQDV